MDELKACPFCGCEEIGNIIFNGVFTIGCTECIARMRGDNEENLIKAWNTRTPEKDL